MAKKILIECSATTTSIATLYERKFLFWKEVASINIPSPYCQELIDFQEKYNVPDKNVFMHISNIKFPLK